MNYAIIDVETTGINAKTERITEVAIIVHNGVEVVEEFSSLVNPERKIPYRIRELTGINDKMVEDAPKFFEIAKKIVEMTEDCYFVAHNAAFDYNFIRYEFKRLGYEYKRNTICTKKLSKKLMPELKSYGLGKLAAELGIINEARHRALGDTKATVELFEHLLSLEQKPEDINLRGIQSNIPKEILKALPEDAGVYYFLNGEGKIIYIGKSVNIKDRVLSHFSNNTTKRAMEMRDQIMDITYERTGSELIALLLESDEIKTHSPKFNRAQRRKSLQYGLYKQLDKEGYIRLEVKRNSSKEAPMTSFGSLKQAREFLFGLIERHELCQKLCGLYKSDGACFQFHIKQCHGACCGEESMEDYNKRVEEAIKPYLFDHNSFVIIDKGREINEKSVVIVENNRYCGFGFIDENEPIDHPQAFKMFITERPDHRDSQHIIRSHLKHKRVEKVIRIPS